MKDSDKKFIAGAPRDLFTSHPYLFPFIIVVSAILALIDAGMSSVGGFILSGVYHIILLTTVAIIIRTVR